MDIMFVYDEGSTGGLTMQKITYQTRLVGFAEIPKGCVETRCYPQDMIRSTQAAGSSPIITTASLILTLNTIPYDQLFAEDRRAPYVG